MMVASITATTITITDTNTVVITDIAVFGTASLMSGAMVVSNDESLPSTMISGEFSMVVEWSTKSLVISGELFSMVVSGIRLMVELVSMAELSMVLPGVDTSLTVLKMRKNQSIISQCPVIT